MMRQKGENMLTEALISVAITAHAAMIDRYDGEADPHMIALIVAIAAVESNGDPRAIGDGGMAVGVLQIHPIMVQDVNRIQRLNGKRAEYVDADRTSVRKSIEMFLIYTDHYQRGVDYFAPMMIARKWNGGPNGHKKDATQDYAHRVIDVWANIKYQIEEMFISSVVQKD